MNFQSKADLDSKFSFSKRATLILPLLGIDVGPCMRFSITLCRLVLDSLHAGVRLQAFRHGLAEASGIYIYNVFWLILTAWIGGLPDKVGYSTLSVSNYALSMCTTCVTELQICKRCPLGGFFEAYMQFTPGQPSDLASRKCIYNRRASLRRTFTAASSGSTSRYPPQLFKLEQSLKWKEY